MNRCRRRLAKHRRRERREHHLYTTALAQLYAEYDDFAVYEAIDDTTEADLDPDVWPFTFGESMIDS